MSELPENEVLILKWPSSKTRNRFALLNAYLRKQSIVPGGPLTLTIESTAKCNLSCPMCLRERVAVPPKDMEFSLFRKIIDEAEEFLEFAVPYGLGEPLLNPEIFDMISYCKKKGIPAGISTNATILNEEISHRLIDSGLDYIIFAFDGATRETYEAYRKGASYDKVRANIHCFLRVKRERRSKIFCAVQMVMLRNNYMEAKALTRMWKQEGVAIRIKKDEIHNEGSAIPGSTKSHLPVVHPCYHLWRGPMFIHQDGTTYPCCYIIPEEPIGNIRQSTLRELWNSEKFIRLREAHLRGDLREFPSCLKCPAARPLLPVALGSFLVNAHTVWRTIPFFERMAQLRSLSVIETLK
jgi:radical SAM protein with 4Fe4S-binding SPASM domain